jgi:hypothetical protein
VAGDVVVVWCGVVGGDEVGDELGGVGGVVVCGDEGVRDVGMSPEGGFDLAELDAVSADLDLVVDAAQVVQLPVRAPAHQITSPIHPATTERVGQVPPSGQ